MGFLDPSPLGWRVETKDTPLRLMICTEYPVSASNAILDSPAGQSKPNPSYKSNPSVFVLRMVCLSSMLLIKIQ
jgi:hypothetical protein